MLFVCLCSGMSIWHWPINWCALCWEDFLAPSFSVPWLLVVICVGWRPCGFFSGQFGRLVGVIFIQLMFWWSCRCDFMWIGSDITANSLIPKLLQYFCPLFHYVSWALGMVICCRYCSLGYHCYCETLWPKATRGKRVYLASTSTLIFILEGSQDRNSSKTKTCREELMQRHQEGSCWLACSHGLLSHLSERIQDHHPKQGTTYNGLRFLSSNTD